jgi:multidrug resistance efflux pump
MKKLILRGSLALIVLGAAYGAYRFFQQLPQRQQQIATTVVRQSDVVIRSYARGELRAVRSAMLIAPNLFGTVQVTRLAPLGGLAKEKDLIAEFDDSEVRSRLEEKQLELDQLDEQLKKALADQAIRNNQDLVELLRSRYSVRRADLEVKRAELKSAIDQKKDLLTLEEARRRLKQLESDIQSRLQQSEAELAVLREKKNKGLLELKREQQRLMQVKLLAPMSGLVAIRQSRPMGVFFAGMQLPDIREGDQVFPGTPVADVLDLSELEVAAKVGELDRANLHEGQDVLMQLDAVAGKRFHGKIKSMSGTASANVWSGDPAKKFDVVFSVDMKELLTGLGAKPEQIRKVLETAEQNRKKPPVVTMMSSMMGGSGGAPGGLPGEPGGQAGAVMVQMGPGATGGSEAAGMAGQEGGSAREGRGGRGGRGGTQGGAEGQGERRTMRFGGQMSEEDQKKVREALEKALGGRNMRDLSPEERQQVIAKVQETVKLPAMAKPAAAGADQQAGGAGTAGATVTAVPGAPGEGRRAMASGAGGPGGTGGSGDASGPPRGFGMGSSLQFSDKDLENAKLPPPPEEDSQLEVLLRPGLLADVEIIVEKIPNAIHIPVQAVFEKEGKPVVYVKVANTFEPRVIKPLKRSESTMVIAEGLKAGEILALADPTARKGEKKEQKPAGGAGPSMPVGGGAGGGPRGGR